MFLLSMIGAVYEIRSTSKAVDVTKLVFVERKLTEYEKSNVLASGMILVEFERDKTCGANCEDFERYLRNLVTTYGNIVVSVYTGDENKVRLLSPFGVDEEHDLSSLNTSSIEEFICGNSLKKPEICILREIT